ncbi:MAG: zinc-dependent alcohol dehydrogenase family protein [Steroidobacteraceae bacterium]
MQAYVVQQGATSLEGLRRVERPDPRPGAGQVLVRMRAAALNYRDQLIVAGTYFGGSVARDTIPMSDGAGEVVEIGHGVTRFKVGDRLTATFFRGWAEGPPRGPLVALGNPADGILAEYAVLDQNDAAELPKSLSFEEGATLACAGVTAWNAIVRTCGVKPGQAVLIMGTGGVSLFALQFARAVGARIILISSSDEKIERGRALGADVGINYRRAPEWEQEVLRATAGRGVDHIVEVGGPGTLARSMRAIGYGGHIALIGLLAGFEGDTGPHPLMVKGAALHGIFVGNRSMLEELSAAIDVNGLKPVIDRVFDFGAAHEAFRHQRGGAFGKVVIRI